MSDQNRNTSNKSDHSDLDDLARRVEAAKGQQVEESYDEGAGPLLGMAWRISTELVVATFVGAGLGYGIDYLAGTKPIFTLLGLILGIATGLRNTFRLVQKMEEEELERLKNQGKL